MKKFFRVIALSLAIGVLFLPQIAFADDMVPGEVCSHGYVHIEKEYEGETCTGEIYSFIKICYLCGAVVESGTIIEPKAEEDYTHTFRWYTVMCIKGQHTYEIRCSICGFVGGFEVEECSGPPCPEVMSLRGIIRK